MSYHNRNFDDYEPRPQSKDYHRYHYPQVEFSAMEERYYTKEPAKAKRTRKSQIALLLFPFIFLAAACSLGATSTAMKSWWTLSHDTGTSQYEWIRLSLWEGCIKETKDGAWNCEDYDNNKNSESPFDKMEVLQICMITATAIAGVATISTIFIAIARDKTMFKPLVYIVCLLCLAAAVLFGICIAFASEEKEAVNLVPLRMKNVGGKLDHGMMFYFAIGAASSAFMALIFYSVFLFVSDDDYDDNDSVSNSSENVKPSKNKQGYNNKGAGREGNDYERYDFEREISQRGHNVLNHHRHQSVYPHKAQELDVYKYHQPPRGMENPRDRPKRTNSNNARDDRRRSQKGDYQSETPYDYAIDQGYRPYRELHRDVYGNHQPAVIGGPQVGAPTYGRYPPNHHERYPTNHHERYPTNHHERNAPNSVSNSSLPGHRRQPSRYFELQPGQPKFFQQRPSSVPLDNRVPSKKQYRKPGEHPNYGEYEMYFNSPY